MTARTDTDPGPLRFSVVVPTLGRTALLEETLASVAACDPPPAEVIVVDGDPGRSAEAVVERFPAARYLQSPPGIPVQRNRALDAATGDVVVFLDDDVAVDPSLFARLAEAYASPAVVGVTTRVVEPLSRRVGHQVSAVRRFLPGGGRPGSFTRFGYPRYLTDPTVTTDVEFMPGCMMSARLGAARAVRFDEALGGYALAEDEDFSYRLSRLGRIRHLGDVTTEHRKTGFTTADPRKLGRMLVRNRRYLFRKNFPQTPLARTQFGLFLGGLFLHRLVNGDWEGARGIVDGLLEG